MKKPSRKSAKRRAKWDGWPLVLTGAALLLGGLGIGLFIGTQIRHGAGPVKPAAAATRPPAVTATAPIAAPPQREAAPRPVPPEHNPEDAEDHAVPPRAAAPRPPAAPGVQQAVLSIPKPPAPAGTPPWRLNAVAPPPIQGRAMLAVVIDDMGLDRRRSARAAGLPGPLTLSYLPYAEELPQQTGQARSRGHELMVHVPMEPLGTGNHPGPQALTVGLATDEIVGRLRRDLTRFDGFVGINNHMGSKFTGNSPGMAAVMAELRARGLLWLDSRTAAGSVGMSLARAYEVPHIERDVFLDNTPTLAAVQRQLADLEAVAKRRGWAVAIGHPKDATIDALAAWLPTLGERGFVLVPLTHLVRQADGSRSG